MLRVLIADDEKAIRNGLQILLDWKSIGFEVTAAAANGVEALQLLKQQPIDVVIADVRMPRMDGLELVQQLKQSEHKADVIIISGYNDFEYARRAIEFGVRNYLLKPIDAGQLTKTLVQIKADKEKQFGEKFGELNCEIIQQVKEYIERNSNKEISLNQLAQQLNYNPVYLGRLFKKEVGKSFRSYLNLIRAKKAALLMLDGRYKVHEVSEMVGYKDLNYFCSVFKEIYGVPPSEFKHVKLKTGI